MAELDNEEKLNRKETVRNLKARRDLETIGALMSIPEGRRFMNYLLGLCGIMKLSYSGPGKAEDTAFYEGQRNIGNMIFRVLDEHFPKEYALMRNESKMEDVKNG